MPVLDANILLRHITRDNPEQGERSMALLEKLREGKEVAFLPEGVVVEVVQVLSSNNLYQLPRDQIRSSLSTIISFGGIEMPNKRTYLRALDIYLEYNRLSFVDSLCAAHAQRFEDATVISFDRGFRNVEGVTRVEP